MLSAHHDRPALRYQIMSRRIGAGAEGRRVSNRAVWGRMAGGGELCCALARYRWWVCLFHNRLYAAHSRAAVRRCGSATVLRATLRICLCAFSPARLFRASLFPRTVALTFFLLPLRFASAHHSAAPLSCSPLPRAAGGPRGLAVSWACAVPALPLCRAWRCASAARIAKGLPCYK